MSPRARKPDPCAYHPRPRNIRAARFVIDESSTCGNIEQVFDDLDLGKLGYTLAVASFRGQFRSATIRGTHTPDLDITPGDWLVVDHSTVHVLPDHEFTPRYEAVT